MHSIPTLGQRLILVFLASLLTFLAIPLAAQPVGENAGPGEPEGLRVYAHTLEFRSADATVLALRHRLSPRGTLEVQPGTNTVVVRDVPSVIASIRRLLEELDLPPVELRLELRVLRAGPANVISPQPTDTPLPENLLARLQQVLRYETYAVVAEAALTSKEGESVEYQLGDRYRVKFDLGEVVGARRLQMSAFQVLEEPSPTAAKGRRLEPTELFNADLNLWLGRPFTLVLTRDETRQEALLVAVTAQAIQAETGH